jgi:type I restriction enzyme, S subunit
MPRARIRTWGYTALAEACKKPPIEGSSTSATALFRVRAGQFIYSRPFAFEGAYATVPEDFDGCFVSNEFPSFETDPDQLDARWLASYLRSPERWAELASSSVGLGVRRQRVPVESLLAYEVLLPPLAQQREMIRLIERVDELRKLRANHDARVAAVVPSLLNKEFAPLV